MQVNVQSAQGQIACLDSRSGLILGESSGFLGLFTKIFVGGRVLFLLGRRLELGDYHSKRVGRRWKRVRSNIELAVYHLAIDSRCGGLDAKGSVGGRAENKADGERLVLLGRRGGTYFDFVDYVSSGDIRVRNAWSSTESDGTRTRCAATSRITPGEREAFVRSSEIIRDVHRGSDFSLIGGLSHCNASSEGESQQSQTYLCYDKPSASFDQSQVNARFAHALSLQRSD